MKWILKLLAIVVTILNAACQTHVEKVEGNVKGIEEKSKT